jgi:hypothetical protein
MRLSAYKEAMDEAFKLPKELSKLSEYFNDKYSPRNNAVNHIMMKARLDLDKLFLHELTELDDYLCGKLQGEEVKEEKEEDDNGGS